MKQRELVIKKFKPMDKERLILSFDRLTRFKPTEKKYLRVFSEILSSCLIEPKIRKQDLSELGRKEFVRCVEFIVNASLQYIVGDVPADFSINKKLLEYELSVFEFDDNVKILVDNKINYSALIKLIDDDNSPNNLKWLKLISLPNYTPNLSYLHKLKFPVKKLIICEGITEEILLPEFARVLDYDFYENGVQMISAGGKNQVVKMFYEFSEILKIPVFVLLDSDAMSNYEEIKPKLRKQDEVYLLKDGEFEDILSVSLIEKTLKFSIENISTIPSEEPTKAEGMVHYLTEFYKKRGIHDFKKSDFALALKENISGKNDVSGTFCEIIERIKKL